MSQQRINASSILWILHLIHEYVLEAAKHRRNFCPVAQECFFNSLDSSSHSRICTRGRQTSPQLLPGCTRVLLHSFGFFTSFASMYSRPPTIAATWARLHCSPVTGFDLESGYTSVVVAKIALATPLPLPTGSD